MSSYYLMDKVKIRVLEIFHILALMLFFQTFFQLLPYITHEANKIAGLAYTEPPYCICFYDLFAQAAPALMQNLFFF